MEQVLIKFFLLHNMKSTNVILASTIFSKICTTHLYSSPGFHTGSGKGEIQPPPKGMRPRIIIIIILCNSKYYL